MYNLEFYETTDARCPVSDFLDSLDKKIIITNGFVKKTRKTPLSEIKLAKDRRSDWINRFGNHIRSLH